MAKVGPDVDSLPDDPIKLEQQRRLAWLLHKDDTHKSTVTRFLYLMLLHGGQKNYVPMLDRGPRKNCKKKAFNLLRALSNEQTV